MPAKMRQHKKTARPGESKRFEQPKILVQAIGKTIIATYDEENYYIKDAIILSKKEHSVNGSFDLKYILALLNSKLLQFIYSTAFPSIQVAKNELAQLPIKPASPEKQQEFTKLVDKMLSLNNQLNDPAFVDKKEGIEKEIEKIDHEINENVYQLYGITEKERRLVKDAV